MHRILFSLALFFFPIAAFSFSGAISKDAMAVTSHEIEINSETLSYTATVGGLDVHDRSGKVVGQIFFTAYTKNDVSSVERPLTFVFNGGPGSSAVWLHLGAFGPKRVLGEKEGQKIAPPYRWMTNEETILDLTDLVFIDPIDTGFSRTSEVGDPQFYDLYNDISSIGDFIRDYITIFNRWQSPKYVAGESYGTTRAAGLSKYLHEGHGIYLNGLILVSVAIDFQTFVCSQGNYLPNALFVPTYAAAAWYHKKLGGRCDEPLEKVLDDARAFTFFELMPALMQGNLQSPAAKKTTIQNLSSYIGIVPDVLDQYYPHFDENHFLSLLKASEKQMVGRMDSRYTSPTTNMHRYGLHSDPSCAAIDGFFTGVMNSYLRNELEVKEDVTPYTIFSNEANRRWQFLGKNDLVTPSTMDALRWSMVINPDLRIFVGSGYYDLATPFAATEYTFHHLDLPDYYQDKIEMHYYEGGHMYYLDRAAHKKFKQDLIPFFKNN